MYYDALVSKWATLIGTTQEKLAEINALTVILPARPMIVPTYTVYNLIDAAEFVALTDENKQLVRDILSMGVVDASPGTQVRAVIVSIFPGGTTTLANLAALAATFDTPSMPWWQAPWDAGGGGLSHPVTLADLEAAGGLS